MSRILHSASALKPKSICGQVRRKEYDKAYNYLMNYRRNMDYASYRAEHLPIGSGVTEAACKTVFTQRFKCSGMIWTPANARPRRPPIPWKRRGRGL